MRLTEFLIALTMVFAMLQLFRDSPESDVTGMSFEAPPSSMCKLDGQSRRAISVASRQYPGGIGGLIVGSPFPLVSSAEDAEDLCTYSAIGLPLFQPVVA